MHLSKNEIKYLKSLSQKKIREEEAKFILEGWKPISDALQAQADIDLYAVVPSAVQTAQQKEVVSRLQSAGIRKGELTEVELSQIAGTVQAQGIIALVRQRHASMEDLLAVTPKLVVACDQVNDPGNLGSIVRTCDWFGVGHLLLSTGSVSLYNEKVVRATTGSLFHVMVVEESDLATDLGRLRQAGYRIVMTAADGSARPDIFPSLKKLVLVLGSEAHGIRPAIKGLADDVVAIPRYGRAESLNVGVACGVLLGTLRNSDPGASS